MMDLRWALEPSRLFNRPQLDHEFPVIETLQGKGLFRNFEVGSRERKSATSCLADSSGIGGLPDRRCAHDLG